MFFPDTAFAAEMTADQLFRNAVTHIIDPIIMVFFMMAIIVFVFGIFEFIRGSDNEDSRRKGQKHMIWGIVGLLIMVSVFALINLIADQFGIREEINRNLGETDWILDR